MESVFNRVSTIFKERYGANLKIDQEFTGHTSKGQMRKNNHSPFVYSRTLRQVSFPIFNQKQELNAIVTASPVENKDAVVFAEMAQFLQLTIAEHMSLSEQLELSSQTLEVVERAHADKKKVVELRTRKKSDTPHFTFKDRKMKKEADFHPIWISGDKESLNSHIAFSVHDWIGNWAFINAEETPDLVWEDPHHWQNFPQVTLFIPNVDQLPKNKIKLLLENLKQVRQLTDEQPLVIVTSKTQIPEELESLKKEFKHYKANENVTARVQAHFLVFHHKQGHSYVHDCDDTKGLYFLPFSPHSTLLH